MKARITAKFIPMLFEFMAKEDVRFYLNGFNIKPFDEGGTILTATDGHRLITIWDEEGYSDGEYIIPISKEIKRFASKREAGCVELFQNAFWVVSNFLKLGKRRGAGIELTTNREIGDFSHVGMWLAASWSGYPARDPR